MPTYRCNKDLFDDCGEHSFTKGKDYRFVEIDDDYLTLVDNQGCQHSIGGGYLTHFTKNEDK